MAEELIDLSVPISETMLTWPTDPKVTLAPIVGEFGGHRITLHELHFGTHTGTHIDAPLHAGVGPGTVDGIPLDTLIGPVQVVDLRGMAEINAETLEEASAGDLPRVLLRTDNSAWICTGPVPEVPVYLTEDGAQWLVAQGVRLVGIDGLTVDPPGLMSTHLVLLEAGVVIVETLDLSEVAAGEYELFCLPLRLAGADGAPARVVLRL